MTGVTSYGDGGTGYTLDRSAAASEPPRADAIDFAGMSGSQILAFMSVMMKNIDQDLAARADVLKGRNEESKALSEQIAILERLSALGKAHGDETTLTLYGEDVGDDNVGGDPIDEWLGHDGAAGEVRAFLKLDTDERHAMQDVGAIDMRIAELKARQNEIGSSSEMDMIGFQSLVQSRQMFVNLATQMMNSEHDAQNNVVRNIG